ncbi:MAG: acetyltransferase [Pseudodesulfovibrio sp.]|uniref:Sugar O-acyltransferase, sialic acid O-acetyltransferase NeuD family n=1 Tax=Pseudodesulfovibrio aespoeensis (strain ATCC 700646 / DSM 10631 / Aspo-2) TaxID=643562 RepID=E6VR74_PSEA9|nr:MULTISPECIES: acetyltransferase [Pseudodesulfovibrio]MBU4191570.1 acetyltransferase [Pseudomonadota bacterium]ADU64158.1 sugar O-acyltransferase, sialic acid O-acetyltransferase NeuD family [Pseudodesulfovibrio aespoeensis Aspo-2]MBU4245174.1 acetyltransferase [Pseudomonadota bacterium]MBU4378774.1 acetyltransferase [Pseudomonadota bacterium]MBU4475478.1 acetyltransferase [Pseudomonadota bacterium]
MKVLILGGGGHASVVADILAACAGVSVLGYIAPEPPPGQVDLVGLPRLGDEAAIATIAHDGVVVAIGDNRVRMEVAERLTAQGETLVSAIHPSAVIAPGVAMGPGCMVCAGVVVNPGATIGRNTILNTGCTVDHHCVLGDHVHIAPGVNLAGGVTVGNGAFIGIGACVIPGVTLGQWVVVGAGAAVIRDVGAGRSVVGVPARERT